MQGVGLQKLQTYNIKFARNYVQIKTTSGPFLVLPSETWEPQTGIFMYRFLYQDFSRSIGAIEVKSGVGHTLYHIVFGNGMDTITKIART